jgi:hypothetical protein
VASCSARNSGYRAVARATISSGVRFGSGTGTTAARRSIFVLM